MVMVELRVTKGNQANHTTYPVVFCFRLALGHQKEAMEIVAAEDLVDAA